MSIFSELFDDSASYTLFDVPRKRGTELMNQIDKTFKSVVIQDLYSLMPTIKDMAQSDNELKWLIYLYGCHSIRIKQSYILSQLK